MTTTTTLVHRGEMVADSQHQFRVLGHGPIWDCRFRIYARADGIAVVLYESPGSVLPVPLLHVEQIASEVLPNVVEDAGNRDRVTWVLHIPSKVVPLTTGLTTPECFARVTFLDFVSPSDPYLGAFVKAKLPQCKLGWFSKPMWEKIEQWQLEAIIGMPWDAAVPAQALLSQQWRETR